MENVDFVEGGKRDWCWCWSGWLLVGIGANGDGGKKQGAPRGKQRETGKSESSHRFGKNSWHFNGQKMIEIKDNVQNSVNTSARTSSIQQSENSVLGRCRRRNIGLVSNRN